MATVSPTGIYYRAAGEAQSTVEAQALAVANSVNNAIGLVPVVPSSVAVGSGSASSSSTGLVTFTGVTNVSLNSCFSSAYTNYRIVYRGTGTVDTGFSFQLRVAGTTNSSANYDGHLCYWGAGGAGYVNQSNSNQIGGIFGHAYQNGTFEVFRPYLSDITAMTFYGAAQNLSGATEQHTSSGNYKQATSFDGFTLTFNGGTFTGTVQVYGYR
jgi:hypothetical protein